MIALYSALHNRLCSLYNTQYMNAKFHTNQGTHTQLLTDHNTRVVVCE